VLRKKASKPALSLLELIIAIAILSSGIIFIMQAFSYSVRVTGLSCDIVRAANLAQDKMQEFEFKEKQGLINKEIAAGEGETDKFRWKYNFGAIEDSNLSKMNLSVSWDRAGRKENIELSTYLRQ